MDAALSRVQESEERPMKTILVSTKTARSPATLMAGEMIARLAAGGMVSDADVKRNRGIEGYELAFGQDGCTRGNIVAYCDALRSLTERQVALNARPALTAAQEAAVRAEYAAADREAAERDREDRE